MPVKIPDPIIIVDTREQKPFVFECATEVRKLDTGDYSIEGYTHRVAVERKSISDFIGSVTNSRPRFMREVERMGQMRKQFKHVDRETLICIVVEGALTDVKMAAEYTGANFNSLIATAASLHASWNIPVIFGGERWIAARYTEELMKKWYRTAVKRGTSME